MAPPTNPRLRVSQVEYARMRGVSPTAVGNWVRRGRIELYDRKVDVELADRALAERSEIYRGGQVGGSRSKTAQVQEAVGPGSPLPPPSSGSAATGTARAVAMKEGYLALLKQIEYDERAGFVVMVDDVARELAAEYAAVKNLVMGMASKLAPRVVACRTASEAEAVIRTECEQVLRTLAER